MLIHAPVVGRDVDDRAVGREKLKLAAVAKLPEMRKEFKAMRRAIMDLEKAAGIPSRLLDSEAA
jgi:hypothetical protein